MTKEEQKQKRIQEIKALYEKEVFLDVGFIEPFETSEGCIWSDELEDDVSSDDEAYEDLIKEAMAEAGLTCTYEEREAAKDLIDETLWSAFLKCQKLSNEFGLGFKVGEAARYLGIESNEYDEYGNRSEIGGWESSNYC